MTNTRDEVSMEIVAGVPDLRVVVLMLEAGQQVPWHHHSNIEDRFICMEGPMLISLRAPDDVVRLAPGETFTVATGRPHEVRGEADGPCKFAIVQGIGEYDYVSEP